MSLPPTRQTHSFIEIEPRDHNIETTTASKPPFQPRPKKTIPSSRPFTLITILLDRPHAVTDHPHLNQTLRRALISVADDASDATRSCISGHTPEGDILQRPHLMILPLIKRISDGHPLICPGLQLMIPNDEPEIVRLEIELIARRLDHLHTTVTDSYGIKRVIHHKTPYTTPHNILCAKAASWTTITPLMLDRFPKKKHPTTRHKEITTLIEQACRHQGIPRPQECVITYHGLISGIPPFHRFPTPELQYGRQRPLVHTTLIFKHPVKGPIVLGASRYKGFGVFAPLGIATESKHHRTDTASPKPHDNKHTERFSFTVSPHQKQIEPRHKDKT